MLLRVEEHYPGPHYTLEGPDHYYFFMLVSNYWLITVFILQASSDGQLQVGIRGPHPRVSMYNDLYIRQMFATQPSRRLDLHVYRFRARELVVA